MWIFFRDLVSMRGSVLGKRGKELRIHKLRVERMVRIRLVQNKLGLVCWLIVLVFDVYFARSRNLVGGYG